ncbi:MAG: BamA/TamA family outer membrane protein [Chitinophagaceae bacterium]
MTSVKNDSIDLTDVIKKGLKFQNNKSDKIDKVQFSALPAAGYAMHTGWAGMATANIAIQSTNNNIAERRTSSISTSITYTQFKQILFPIQANLWLHQNKINVLVDWRYIKYPSKIYNTSSDTGIPNEYFVDYEGLKLHQVFLRSLRDNIFIGLGWYYDHLWKIREMDIPTGAITDFQRYGLQERVTASSPVLKLLYDSRMNVINPQSGSLFNITYRPSNMYFGSSSNWSSLQIELRKYLPFPKNSKNILALWNHNWFTTKGTPPYLMLPSTGWDDSYNLGRGYIQGRYRDRNMIYGEMEYRMQITKNGLLGATLFGNFQYYSNYTFKNYSQIIPGYGFGLRIKVNKYSGANICIDYGFGKNHSRGFAVNLGEIF